MGSLIWRKKKIMMMQGQGLLPPEYQQIEYLQGTGTQYIATNYIAPAGVSIEWDYALTGTISGDKMMWGAKGATDARCYGELYTRRWYGGNGYAKYYPVLSDKGTTIGIKYHAKIDSTLLTVDGYSDSPTALTYLPPTVGIYIFAWNNGNNSPQYIHNVLRMYNLIFTYNGQLSAKFVPCIRISDNKPGMYDLVNRTFYTNAGTGEFIIPQ